MPTSKEKQQELLRLNLQSAITEFYQNADILSCIDSISYLAFSMDEEVEPLTSMDNVNMRSLMRLLIDLSRLKQEGMVNS